MKSDPRDHDVNALRQALWDIFGILGGDQDGARDVPNVTPLIDLTVETAREMRKDYDELLMTTSTSS